MIVYPKNWRQLGQEVTIANIDEAMRQIILEINCINLSFSGGVDSSLLLYYLLEVKGEASAFTVANDIDHPDIEYSQRALAYYEERYQLKIPHHIMIKPKLSGDDLVISYYKALSLSCLIPDIIEGDGIDELACGYYEHQDLREETYQNCLQELQAKHLKPLDENSGDVKVYLPYADDRLVNLFYRIPLYQKVNKDSRKIIVMQLAQGKVPLEIIERKKYGFATSCEQEIVV